MIDFKELLVLIYLNDYSDEYLLAEIKELCSFSTAQLKKCLDDLTEKKLLSDENGRLLLTSEGEAFLNEKGLLEASISDLFQDTVTLKFIEKPLSFEDIYIPKAFKI